MPRSDSIKPSITSTIFITMTFLTILILIAIVIVRWEVLSRPFADDSKLRLGELRITHIPAEFNRRSPEFAKAWEDFKECAPLKECDLEPILTKRDVIIKREWPLIFDRVIVYDDWGTNSESKAARDSFFSTLDTVGRDKLRNDCVPSIQFLWMPSGIKGSPSYYHQGRFTCRS